MRFVRALGVAVALLGACGGDDSVDRVAAPDELPPCLSLYAEGRVFLTKDDLENAYCDADGEPYLAASATQDCLDGETLYWNDEGWGYLGQPFHRHDPGAPHVAPETERNACTG